MAGFSRTSRRAGERLRRYRATGTGVFDTIDTRYQRARGLRRRLNAAARDGQDLHITIDLTELRRRTVRRRSLR